MTAVERVASVLTADRRLIQCGSPLVDEFGKENVTVDMEPSLVFHVQFNDCRVDVRYAREVHTDPDDIVLGDKVIGVTR